MKKRILSIVLAVALMIPSMPVMAAEVEEVSVSAGEEENAAEEIRGGGTRNLN